jgi:hypothetical protein
MFEAIEAFPLAAWLRQSVWAYPIVNTLHILGVALLIGSVVALDLRLLGLWRRAGVAALARVLAPLSFAGFALAACMGVLLFIVRAADYAPLWLFQVKMALLVLALANAMILLRSAAWRRLAGPGSDEYVPPRLRLLAALSLLLWLGVMTFGRLVGYA